MSRALIIIAAIVSVFTLPSFITALLAAAGSILFPPTALAIGVLYDALYLPLDTVPYATLLGLAGSTGAVIVRHIMKTRIIGT